VYLHSRKKDGEYEELYKNGNPLKKCTYIQGYEDGGMKMVRMVSMKCGMKMIFHGKNVLTSKEN